MRRKPFSFVSDGHVHDRDRAHAFNGRVPSRRGGHRGRSSQHDSRAPRLYLCLCTSLCASRCHDDANGYHAIHSDDASNHGRASCHRPSSYRNCHDRLFVILPTAAG